MLRLRQDRARLRRRPSAFVLQGGSLVILAIDTGSATLGWAHVTRPGRIVNLGSLIQPQEENEKTQEKAERRAVGITNRLLFAMAGVDGVAAEALSYPRNASAAAALALCWGVIVATTTVQGLPRFPVPPKAWQRALLGIRRGDTSLAKQFAGDKVKKREVARRMRLHIAETGDQRAKDALAGLKGEAAGHALDAAAIGVFVATIARWRPLKRG